MLRRVGQNSLAHRLALPWVVEILPVWLAAVVVVACAARALSADPFAEGVRPTNALTPTQQEKSFHLPPGFRIQLFASEPDIQKPMNLAFDARGRLWMSGSTEYPYAAPLDKAGRDSIRVLEDTDGDGRADKVTTFADGLNVPIGLYPYRHGVIAFSIPNIYYFEDTDGDDKADQRHPLFGPLDYTRDLHGMSNAFRRGFDGWIYACHGWANQDTVAGKDGHTVTMHGGNGGLKTQMHAGSLQSSSGRTAKGHGISR